MSKKRNTLVLFIMILLTLLLLTPFDGVSPTVDREVREDGVRDNPPAPQKDIKQGFQQLNVTVSLEPLQFAALNAMNQQYMSEHGIYVELKNLYPADSYRAFLDKAQLGDAPDVMLLQSEWIHKFAVSGFLLPVDSYFTGVEASEPLDLLINQVKWNGYTWGVPKDLDPYVFVWNERLLRQIEATKLPVDREGWINVQRAFEKIPNKPYLLATNTGEPFELLSMLWRLGPVTDSVALLDMLRPNLYTVHHQDSQELWDLFAGGKLLAFMTTLSEAEAHRNAEMKMEVANPQNSKLPYWVHSRSFAVSARTQMENEAKEWIQAMTTKQAQMNYWDKTGILPGLKLIYTNSSIPSLQENMRQRLMGIMEHGFATSPNSYEQLTRLAGVFGKYVKSEQPLKSITDELKIIEMEREKADSIQEERNRMREGTPSVDIPPTSSASPKIK